MDFQLSNRTHILKNGKPGDGPVIYWMQRDQRVDYNWAFLASYFTAAKNDKPLIVVFNLVDDFISASIRHYQFMLEGLKEVADDLEKLNIPFKILKGNPDITMPEFVNTNNASYLFTDFSPLNIVKNWKVNITKNISIPFYEIDTHNIVPCRAASQKPEFAAYTIRPKINNLLPQYLLEFPELSTLKNNKISNQINWEEIYKSLKISNYPGTVKWIKSGRKAALTMLEKFANKKLNEYDENRNNPNLDALSNLSVYLHYGQISSNEIAIYLNQSSKKESLTKSFLEELIVRKELSDNFCHYNQDYDNFSAFPDWAKRTLNTHRSDKREYIYSLTDFENAETHDELWNAAQMEMVIKGKMHGYLRMYWAKKILEWTNSPEETQNYAIYLNDKYELDGRDPNGYAGIAWSIGGVHDRAWSERPVFGKIRFMNYNGCKRKFDIQKYILSVKNI